MNFQIKLAEQIIEINSLYKQTYAYCARYRVNDQNIAQPDIVVTITQEDIEKERLLLQQENVEEGAADLNVLNVSNTKYLERSIVYKKIAASMLTYDTLLMHGVLISTEGQGYIITAPSGVGKSTRALLWLQSIPESMIVNGDKPLIRITDDTVYAYGTPWSGKEKWDINISVPLRAIFLLERARYRGEFFIEEVSIGSALSFLLRQTFREEDEPAFTRKVIQLLYRLKGNVKFFRLCCEPSVESVKRAYETVRIK